MGKRKAEPQQSIPEQQNVVEQPTVSKNNHRKNKRKHKSKPKSQFTKVGLQDFLSIKNPAPFQFTPPYVIAPAKSFAVQVEEKEQEIEQIAEQREEREQSEQVELQQLEPVSDIGSNLTSIQEEADIETANLVSALDAALNWDNSPVNETTWEQNLVDYYVALNANKPLEEIVTKEEEEETLIEATENLTIEETVFNDDKELSINNNDLIQGKDDHQALINQTTEKEKIKEVFQKSVWNEVKNRQEYLSAFMRVKADYQDMKQCLNDFKESLKEIDEKEIVKWITDGDTKLDGLFSSKDKYPVEQGHILAILLAEQEVYCKERAKGPTIKSWTGYILSFVTTIYTGPFKIEGMSEAQLDLLSNGVTGFHERLNSPQSNLYQYKDALLENRSDSKGFIDQVLQFSKPDVTDKLVKKESFEKELKSGLTLFTPKKEIDVTKTNGPSVEPSPEVVDKLKAKM